MLKNIRLSFDLTLLIFLIPNVVLMLAFFIFIKLQHQNRVEQINSFTQTWLEAYSETLLADIQLGNTYAVNRKVILLANKGFFTKVTLFYGDNKIEHLNNNEEILKTSKILSNIITWFAPNSQLITELKDTYFTNWGRLDVQLNPSYIYGKSISLYFIFIIIGVSILLFTAGIILLLIEFHSSQMNKVIVFISRLSKSSQRPNEIKSLLSEKIIIQVRELDQLMSAYSEAILNFVNLEQKYLAGKIQAHTGLIAKQVAHDIRSPLTALDVVMRTEAGMSEEKRILARSAIARINDIANDLLVKNRDKENKMLIDSNVKLNEKRAKSIVLLASLLESLLSEKRLQYRAMLDVDIEYQSTENTYGLFADVDPIEFKRLISNIINNAVEALPNSRGKVELLLSGDQNNISIVIKDNGKGVPSHILPTLGTRGVSYGKDVGTESGTGLGLHHAKSTIESLGGHFEIQSEVGVGTVIKIKLKKVAAPNWFLEKLAIRSDSRIVVVDDDASIHQIWKGRFESLRATKYGVEILNFSSPNDLKNWFEKRSENSETIFLIDYEFLGQTQNGLDIIKALHLEKQAVLVTSRYEEPQIFHLAQQMGVKMIPKGIAGLVPIEFIIPAGAVDAVLIDDDELVHMAWSDAAKEANKVIKTFFTYDDFLTEHRQLTQRAPIYIDVSLAGGVRGEEVAKKVFDLGFNNIYLATGFEKTEFNNLSFLKGVIGKDPPWVF